LLADSAGKQLAATARFLEPYIEAARARGEARRDLDVQAASEWFGRILISLYTTPSQTMDLEDPEVAMRFVRDHVVVGFGPHPTRPELTLVPHRKDAS
jgi:hypothetical protein